MARNPLTIIRGHIGFFEETLQQSQQAGEPVERINELDGKLSLLRMLEADMEIEYFELGEETTIGDLCPGAVFATGSGTYAVKSEYYYSTIDPVADERGVNCQCQCILLESGEFAHFSHGNATIVWEVIQPRRRESEDDPSVS